MNRALHPCAHCSGPINGRARLRFCSQRCANTANRQPVGPLTAERARELFAYDPSTGALTRRIRVGKQAAGSLIDGDKGNGYIRVVVNRKPYTAHRLAWLMVTGAWPQHQIDHINGDRLDNRFVNLRDVPSAINSQNRRTPKPTNTLGLMGVRPTSGGGRFTATLSVGNKPLRLGSFATPDEAHEVYLEAKRRLHPGCTI